MGSRDPPAAHAAGIAGFACTAEEWEDALYGGRGKVTGGWDGLDKVNKILLTPNTTDTFGVLDSNTADAADGIPDTETWCCLTQAALERTKRKPITKDVTTEHSRSRSWSNQLRFFRVVT